MIRNVENDEKYSLREMPEMAMMTRSRVNDRK